MFCVYKQVHSEVPALLLRLIDRVGRLVTQLATFMLTMLAGGPLVFTGFYLVMFCIFFKVRRTRPPSAQGMRFLGPSNCRTPLDQRPHTTTLLSLSRAA